MSSPRTQGGPMAEAAAVVRASDLFGAGSRSASRGPAVDWMEHIGQGSKPNSPEPRPEMDTNHFRQRRDTISRSDACAAHRTVSENLVASMGARRQDYEQVSHLPGIRVTEHTTGSAVFKCIESARLNATRSSHRPLGVSRSATCLRSTPGPRFCSSAGEIWPSREGSTCHRP